MPTWRSVNTKKGILNNLYSGIRLARTTFDSGTIARRGIPSYNSTMAIKTDTYADVMQRNKIASERLVQLQNLYSCRPLPHLLSLRLPLFWCLRYRKSSASVEDTNIYYRLRFQLFLWRVRYGWSLPPSVPLRDNPGWEVADVATGSGYVRTFLATIVGRYFVS
jgi:hypothetical protein